MELRKLWTKLLERPSRWLPQKRGEPKMFRAAQHWFYTLKVLKLLTRDKDPLLQDVCPTQIVLAQYGLGDVSEGVLELDYPYPSR